MSRKGRLPVPLPKGVEAKVTGNTITVKGSLGSLTQEFSNDVVVKIDGNQVFITPASEDPELGKFQGLYRTLIDNMVTGVTTGFSKSLKMIGVGYRAAVQGNLLDLQVGLSHPSKKAIPEGIKVAVEKNTTIVISGCDKRVVGQFAAEVRAIRPPEPYQGKGIRGVDERVRRKAGKTAAK